MRLSLEKLVISNFKGIRELEINFAETETHIAGMNGTGKTTLPDAFSWVLFNKDSHGNAPGSDNFREKPLDEDGNEIHNLDTTVELVCLLDGKAFNLKRTQRENWVKKRGSTNPVYQGNASTYWINDVETALKDFKARISEIAPEEIFRLIGTLAAFNAQDWKKRREQLLALSGGDVDGRLLATDEYRPIADACAQRNISIDDLRKVLADQRKRANTELQMIPVRIDEARKALPAFGPHEIEDVEYMAKDIQQTIESIDGQIAEAKAESGSSGVTMQIVALEQEAASLTRQIAMDWSDNKRQLEKQRDEASDDLRRALEQNSTAKASREQAATHLECAVERRDALRSSYSSVRGETFTWSDGERICPTCGQPMPEGKVQEAKEAELRRFNAEKKAKLEQIKRDGADAARGVAEIEEKIRKLDAEIEETEGRVKEAQQRREEVSELIKQYPAEPDFSVNSRIEEIRQQVNDLKAKQAESPTEKIALLTARKNELQQQLDEKRALLAKRDAGAETGKRIEALEAQQRDKGVELAELEQLIGLAERFITDRCAALEESINGCFPTIRWKLFDTQINGGIADTCVCMIPCESGLVAYESANTAAQVNADLEIINVLSKHYDVYIPLFVDGAESVNVLNHTYSQLITLSVSTDEKLTIKEVA